MASEHLTDGSIRSLDARLRAAALGNLDDSRVEDVIQDTWVAALETQNSPHAWEPWLRRVARNFGRLHQRAERRRREREAHAARPERVSSTEEVVQREALRKHVVDAVLGLPEVYRTCLVARYFDQLPPRHIAALLEVPVATVHSRIRRGLEQVRGVLTTGRSHRGLLPLLGAGVTRPHRTAAWQKLIVKGGITVTKSKLWIAAAIVVAVPWGTLQFLQTRSAESEQTTALSSPPSKQGDGSENLESGDLLSPGSIEDRDRGRVTTSIESRRSSRDPLTTTREAEPPKSRADQESTTQQPHSAEDGPILREVERLQAVYQERGWSAVQADIAGIRAKLQKPESIPIFLAVLDAQQDAYFLEALLHHLVRPSPGNLQGLEAIVSNDNLAQEIWDRFEAGQDPARRTAFLSFFVQNPRLRGARREDFLLLARTDPDSRVRAMCLEGLQYHGTDEQVQRVLLDTANFDPDPGCRAAALRGLAKLTAPEAVALVADAFRSDSERLRTAAWECADPPSILTDGDLPSYLRQEFLRAESNALRAALIDRLLETSPHQLQQLLKDQLEREPPGLSQRYYRAALDSLAGGGIADRWDLHRNTRELYVKFRYGDE